MPRAVDLRRRPSSRPLQVAEHLDEEAGHDDFEELVLDLDVREALRSLSSKHREILELHFDEDLTQVQVGSGSTFHSGP